MAFQMGRSPGSKGDEPIRKARAHCASQVTLPVLFAAAMRRTHPVELYARRARKRRSARVCAVTSGEVGYARERARISAERPSALIRCPFSRTGIPAGQPHIRTGARANALGSTTSSFYLGVRLVGFLLGDS